MHEVALDLLILLAGIWLVAVTLRPLGVPTVMGELIVGVLVGPAVFGLVAPGESIQLLAEIGIFFLMFHAGVETQPLEFFDALKRSMGVAIVGALVPFAVSFGLAIAFGLSPAGATFVGLTMTATAVVITLTCLKDLGLANTRVARVIVASCVIDDLLTMVVFSVVIGVLSGGAFSPMDLAITLAKVLAFFGGTLLVGQYLYPRLTLPFRSEAGKGFTFVLLTAFAAGLFAEAIGLHMILGAYLAGLFLEEKVASPRLMRVTKDRTYGIAYSFLGPIFFMTLGFSITFDISADAVAFLVLLTAAVIVGQVLSAGGMALRLGMPFREALTVGVGMCGRAELAFILAALALTKGAIDASVFSVLIFTAFLLNLFTPLALKGCAQLLHGSAARERDATRGVLQLDDMDVDERLPTTLPEIEGGVVVYGYGPEVETLMRELDRRGMPSVVIEEDEDTARRLRERGQQVVYARPAEDDVDLRPLVRARALVTNGPNDGMLALRAREAGFKGLIVALVENPHRRSAIMLSGASVTFTPKHLLAVVLAGRASSRISPLLDGTRPLGRMLDVAEIRVHDASPLAGKTLAEAAVRARTGVNIVGCWMDGVLGPPPSADAPLEPGNILVAAGDPDSIRSMRDLARPITHVGPIVVVGSGELAMQLRVLLTDAREEVFVLGETEREGVDLVGDALDRSVLDQTPIRNARAVIIAIPASDSETVLVVRVVRDYAPDLPIIVGVALVDNVERIQAAGGDFVVSVSQVAGQILGRQVLGETVALQPRIRVVKFHPGRLAGRNPLAERIRERSGCTVVAVERDGTVLTDLSAAFDLRKTDALYVCGTAESLEYFEEHWAMTRL